MSSSHLSASSELTDRFLLSSPAVHSVVKHSAKAFVNQKNLRVKTWGPTITGLAVVPLLPYLFDHPIEYATDVVFEKLEGALATVKSLPNEGRPAKEL